MDSNIFLNLSSSLALLFMLNFANFIFHRRFVVFRCELSFVLSFQFFFLNQIRQNHIRIWARRSGFIWCHPIRRALNLSRAYLYFLQSNTFCFLNPLFQCHNLIFFVRPFFQFFSNRCLYPLIDFYIILKYFF